MEKPLDRAALNDARASIYSRDALLFLGVTDYEIEKRISAGSLLRVYPGLYYVGRELTAQVRLRAALLQASGSNAVACGVAAGWLHRLDGFEEPAVEVLVCHTSTFDSDDATIRRTRKPLAASDVSEIEGFAVTSLARTVVDLFSAEDLPWFRVVMAYEDLYRRGREHRDALVECLKRMRPGRPRLKRLEDLINRRGLDAPATDSGGEARLDDILWRHDIRLDRQVVKRDQFGDFIGRVDFADNRLKVVVEFDGHRTHGKLAGAFYSDRLRDDRLRAIGYEVRRETWADLDDESGIVRRVASAISTQRERYDQWTAGEIRGDQLDFGID